MIVYSNEAFHQAKKKPAHLERVYLYSIFQVHFQVPSLKLGDHIRIIDDEDKAQALQKRHGGWQSDMAEVNKYTVVLL